MRDSLLTPRSDDEAILTRYLLGLSTPEERDQVETRYFSDDSYFELLEAIEAKLIDDYGAGRLSLEESTAFRDNYLSSPRNRRRSEQGAALRAAVDSFGAQRWVFLRSVRSFLSGPNRALRYAGSILVVVLIIGGAYQMRRRSDTVTYFLTEGSVRSMAGERLTAVEVPRSASSVRLRLELVNPVAHESRRAVLRPVGENRNELWSQRVRPDKGATTLELDVHSDGLQEGDYVLTLEGLSGTTASYSFRLTRN